jgi:RNA polymerase sigma-70 factor, ECF subfamily
LISRDGYVVMIRGSGIERPAWQGSHRHGCLAFGGSMFEDHDEGLGATRNLLHLAIDGNEAARGELLERMRPRLQLWVSGRLSPELRRLHDPEDVTQEILLALHKSLDGFRERTENSFYGWMFRVAENRIRDLADYVGAKKRQPVPIVSLSQTTPSIAAIRSERFTHLHEALGNLSEDHRQVIRLRRLEEKSVAEVAEVMGRTENAVRILLTRAMAALGRTMRKA